MAPTMNRQDSHRRAERAHQLRAIGRTWQEVADVLGYSTRGGAIKAVERLLDKTPPETVEQARRMETEELRLRRAALHERFAEARRNGDDDAIAKLDARLDAVSKRRAALLGLDAVVVQKVDVQVSASADAILTRAENDLLALAESRTSQRQLPAQAASPPSTAPIIEAEVIE